MARRGQLGLILTMIAFSGTTAGASAITYQIQEVVLDGLPVYSGLNATLPNPTVGGSVTIGGFAYPNSNLSSADTSTPISGGIGFLLQSYDGSGNAVGPLIDVDGKYQGTLYSGGVPAREAADFTGVITGLSSGFGSPVPEALQGLANDPGRMTVSSLISVGADDVQTIEDVVLTIAPATAPEPSTLVTMISAASLALLARRRSFKRA